MIGKNLAIGVAVAASLIFASLSARADDDFSLQ
jgi:hypothetical protein